MIRKLIDTTGLVFISIFVTLIYLFAGAKIGARGFAWHFKEIWK